MGYHKEMDYHKEKGRYLNISQMGQKYHVEMNSQLGSGFASAVYLG